MLDRDRQRGTAVSVQTRSLAGDGPPVSRIGLGLAALGRPGYQNVGHGADIGPDASVEALRRRSHAVLDAAWAGGVRYVDAARSYGRAEEFLKSWIDARGIAPGELTVGSKWGYRYTAGWSVRADVHEVKDHSLGAFREQLAESRRHLGVHLRLYQIHSATLESGVLGDAGVLDALAHLRDAGIVVGLSVSGPQQADTIARALAVARGGVRLFGCVQATWNVLEPSAGDVLAQAHAAGVGIIVKEALANGRLAGRADADAGPYAGAQRTLASEAHRLGFSADALALAAALAQPWADCVLSGAVRVEHVEANLAALRIAVPADVLERLRALAISPTEYWARRATSVWT
jgi:aryl-alcohol dehydrogenase-like predicted oxidoreductase